MTTRGISIVIAVLAIGFTLALRLSNPTLTETQLLITFWPVWLVFLLIAMVMVLFPVRGGRS